MHVQCCCFDNLREHEVKPETHKGLKRVTRVQCFTFSTYHIWKPSLRPQKTGNEAKQQLCTSITFIFYISLPSPPDYYMKLGACLHGGGGPQVGEVACSGSPQPSCKRDQIKMRDYMERRVTSPTWGRPRVHVTRPLIGSLSNNRELKQRRF